MKRMVFALFICSCFQLNGQIITNAPDSNEEVEQKKTKPKNEKKERKKSNVELFFGVSPAYTFRTLEENINIFGKPLGERVNEQAVWTVSYHAGARTPLTEWLKLEIGAGYYTNKEKYDYEAQDSIYRYVNNYQDISIPIRLAYTYGKDIRFYGALGIIPKAFIFMGKKETFLDINNKETTEKSRERDGYNLFLLDAVGTIGTQIRFNEHYGIYASIEGRRQLVSNYSKQSAYIRKPYALGFNIGIEIYL